MLEQHQLPEKRLLYELSGMLDDDIKIFNHIWCSIPITLKRQLITELRDIAEADFAVDFSAVFIKGLESEDPDICVTAMDGLSEIEDIRLLPRLYILLQTSQYASVRSSAAQILANYVLLGELGKIHQIIFDRVLNELLAAYKKPGEDIEVKRRILEALAYTGTRDIPALIQSAYEGSDEKMMTSSVFSMGRSADKYWAAIVQKELLNPNPEIRFEATRACGELQIKDAVPDLIDLTDDTDVEVQEMALWSLGQIGGSKARRILEQFVHSDNEALSTAAQQAIDELDFFQNGLSSFVGPPSEFIGESEESWFTPEGLLKDNEGNDEPI
jgi:HEAT repeat protein